MGRPRTTKLDVVRYYEAVQEPILPHLRARPLTLVQCAPDVEHCRYLRHSGASAPAQVRVVNIQEQKKIGDYMVIDDVSWQATDGAAPQFVPAPIGHTAAVAPVGPVTEPPAPVTPASPPHREGPRAEEAELDLPLRDGTEGVGCVLSLPRPRVEAIRVVG